MPNLDQITDTNPQPLPFDTSKRTKPLASAEKIRHTEQVPGSTDNDSDSWRNYLSGEVDILNSKTHDLAGGEAAGSFEEITNANVPTQGGVGPAKATTYTLDQAAAVTAWARSQDHSSFNAIRYYPVRIPTSVDQRAYRVEVLTSNPSLGKSYFIALDYRRSLGTRGNWEYFFIALPSWAEVIDLQRASNADRVGDSRFFGELDHEKVLEAIPGIPLAIDTLDRRTGDLTPQSEATGWQTISSDAAGGVALASLGSDPTGLAYTLSPSIVASRGVFVRVPAGSQVAQWRMRIRYHQYSDYLEVLSGFEHRMTAGGWDYYRWSDNLTSDAVSEITLETTSSAAHIGTSSFRGNLSKGKVYQQVKAIIVGGTDSDDEETVTITIPSVTPHSVIERLQDQTKDLIRGADSATPAKNSNINIAGLLLRPGTAGVNLTTAPWTAQVDRPSSGWQENYNRIIIRLEENQELADWEVRVIHNDGSHRSLPLAGAIAVNTQTVATNPETGFAYYLIRNAIDDVGFGGDARIETWTITHETTYVGKVAPESVLASIQIMSDTQKTALRTALGV